MHLKLIIVLYFLSLLEEFLVKYLHLEIFFGQFKNSLVIFSTAQAIFGLVCKMAKLSSVVY